MRKGKVKFVVIVSHPIQYHAVLWKSLAKMDELDFDVFFCSNHGQNASLDKDFGVRFKWDIPLKEGYRSKSFKNIGFGSGFFKFVNLGLLLQLLSSRVDVVYFHGVNNFTAYLAFWICKLKGAKTVIRNIAHNIEGVNKSSFRFILKNFIYGTIFRKSTYCLYIGKHNKVFYKNFKVNDAKLLHAPHVVDNVFFQSKILHQDRKGRFKESLGVDKESLVLLFCGKLIPIKQPKMLLEAFSFAKFNHKVTLLFVGDGILRKELEEMAVKIKTANKEIKFLGFKNQSELPAIYSITDVLVLPSVRETWGLVVNEALNYSNAIIVSDHVGCGEELVKNKTGLIFSKNSTQELQHSLEKMVNIDAFRINCQKNAAEVINNWSVNEFVGAIQYIVNEIK